MTPQQIDQKHDRQLLWLAIVGALIAIVILVVLNFPMTTTAWWVSVVIEAALGGAFWALLKKAAVTR